MKNEALDSIWQAVDAMANAAPATTQSRKADLDNDEDRNRIIVAYHTELKERLIKTRRILETSLICKHCGKCEHCKQIEAIDAVLDSPIARV